MVTRSDILEKAENTIHGDRHATYGDAAESFSTIAKMWSAYRGVDVTAEHVAAMMVLMKISRQRKSKHEDNWIDMIGYAALGGEIEGGK